MQQQAMRAVEPLVQDIGGKAACLFLKQAADVAWTDPHPRRHASDVEARVAQMYRDVGLDRPQPRRLHAGLFPHWLIVRGLGDGSDQVANLTGGEWSRDRKRPRLNSSH